ncbi:MAG: S8 family serine peptidase [Gaiellaceae bacterium]
MPTRRPSEGQAVSLTLLALAVTVVLVAVSGKSAGGATPTTGSSASSWRGLVGSRARVAVGQRVIVVLKSPSLADRVARAGGRATDRQERAWSAAALASQRLLISRLAVQGIAIRPEHSYTRTLNGFSAPLDPAAVALLERDEDVAGVYPVRPAYPASVATGVLAGADFAPGGGHRPDIGLSGVDGRGVTVALLDTGVDKATAYLRGRLDDGIDILGGDPGALPVSKPDEPAQLERHGTEMAGLLVGAGGPSGLAGVATGASILPIRVAGWQQDAAGKWAVYSRSDQILAGLERAVDPNDDGDAHDAARVALIALAEPYAAFTDGPEARAAAGALALDTLVVAPAGNDGAAGPGYGSISGPGGAPSALTVGAVDTRSSTESVPVVVRSGLRVLFDGILPLAGAVRPPGRLELGIATPQGGLGSAAAAPRLLDFFTRTGSSLVAGRAALVAGGSSPAPAAEHAAQAGADAVLLYGTRLPAGGLGLEEEVPVPVVALTAGVAQALVGRLGRGAAATVSIGGARVAPNPDRGRIAAFSSTGLAFDGSVKPDLVAPGVALATSDPGTTAAGAPRFATVNGSSAAAAATAGAAALLAQARPGLEAEVIKSLLVGTASPLDGEGVTAQGAGMVDVGAAAAGEIAARPATLALGRSTGTGWRTRRTFVLRNVSTRPVRLRLGVRQTREGATALDFAVRPRALTLGRGHSATITVRAVTASAPAGAQAAEGVVEARTAGGGRIRVPWTIAFGRRSVGLLSALRLSAPSFRPSDASPALLQFAAGALVRVNGLQEVRPVSRLDVELFNAAHGDLGLLARLRDLLPGRYAFGLTGRDPVGAVLRPGRYRLRLVAWPTDGGPPSTRRLPFVVR